MTETVKLWPFPVNWKESFKVGLAFKTDLLVSDDGHEQRRALRITPRKVLSFSVTLMRGKVPVARRLLASWQNRSFVVGDPTRSVGLAAAATGSATIVLPSIPEWVFVGAPIVLGTYPRIELRSVQSIVGTTVTLTTTGLTWPIGSPVFPGLRGLVSASLNSVQFTDDKATFNVEFDVEPTSEPARSVGAATVSLAGQEVLTLKPNWIDNLGVMYSWDYDQLDYGQGKVTNFREVDFGTQTFKALYSGFSTAKMIELQRFFERMKGRRGEFYMSSGLADLFAAAPLVSGASTLRVPGQEVFQDFADDTVHRAIDILLKDGSHLYRKINSITAVDDGSGSDTLLNLSQAWASNIPTANISRISWMPLCRHASDSATFEWLSNTVGQVQFSIQTLENLFPE